MLVKAILIRFSILSAGTVYFTLPFTTCVTILISIFQTFRSWAATSHPRPPMAFLSHNVYDTPRLAPLRTGLFWGRCDFPISLSGRDLYILKKRLRLSLRTFYGRYGDPIKRYETPSPECYTAFWMMTIYSDTLDLSDITPISTLLLICTLIPNLTFYLITRGFHRTFATGAACQQRMLTPRDTWFCPTLGLASILMLWPISPEFVLFPDFRVSDIHRYFCFTLSTN